MPIDAATRRAGAAAWWFWLGMEDSNPHIQIQSLLSYP
jgi:hypothetical protein